MPSAATLEAFRCVADAECADRFYAKRMCRKHYEKDLRVTNPAYADRQRENVREWAKNNPERKRRSDSANARRRSSERRRRLTLRSKYGIEPEDFDRMLADQGGVCAICGLVGKRWHTDHSHETGVVRGILCSKCNCALGWFNEDVALMAKAAAYLVRN